jgi:hypothetical protein
MGVVIEICVKHPRVQLETGGTDIILDTGALGDFVASGSSLVLPRAAADTRGQYSV